MDPPSDRLLLGLSRCGVASGHLTGACFDFVVAMIVMVMAMVMMVMAMIMMVAMIVMDIILVMMGLMVIMAMRGATVAPPLDVDPGHHDEQAGDNGEEYGSHDVAGGVVLRWSVSHPIELFGIGWRGLEHFGSLWNKKKSVFICENICGKNF